MIALIGMCSVTFSHGFILYLSFWLTWVGDALHPVQPLYLIDERNEV